MTLIVPPEWASEISGVPFHGTWAPLDAAAHLVRATFQNEIHISGGNAVIVGRIYQNSTAAWNGSETLVGAQVVGDAQNAGFSVQVDAGLVTPGNFVAAFWANNTAGNTNGVWTSLADDVGFESTVSSSGSCCHDAMLDEILTAVRRTFPAT